MVITCASVVSVTYTYRTRVRHLHIMYTYWTPDAPSIRSACDIPSLEIPTHVWY